MNITSKVENNSIKLYVNEILYLSLNKKELVGFQSWIEGDKTKRYCIEFYFKTSEFYTGYDNKEKWLAILSELDNIDFHSEFEKY